ncbi:MAG: hypothetical protein AB7S36_07820 [Planctomycetota bacterium]
MSRHTPHALHALIIVAALCAFVSTPVFAQQAIGGSTIDFTGYTGSGFSPSAGAGQIDSNTWSVAGASDGSIAFGGTGTTGDHARGSSAGGVTTGGFYAFDTGGGDIAFGWQAGGSDFAGNLAGGSAGTEGRFVLKLVNNSGSTISALQINWNVKCLNNGDNNRSNAVVFEHSSNNVTYTAAPAGDFASPGTLDALGWQTSARSVTVSGLSIGDGTNYYLRWSTFDLSGAGSRDELAIDDIVVTAPVNLEFSTNNPANAQVSPDAQDQLMASILATPTGGSCTLDSLVLTHGGTGSSTLHIAAQGVTLYRDNGDGSFNALSDTVVGSPTQFSGSTCTLTIGDALSPISGAVRYFIVYDFANTAPNGVTLFATIAPQVTGATPVGSPVTRTVTFQIGASGGGVGGGDGSTSCAAGPGNDRTAPVMLLALLVGVALMRRTRAIA